MLTRIDLFLIRRKLPSSLQGNDIKDEEVYDFYKKNKDKFPEYQDYEMDTEISEDALVDIVTPESNWSYIYIIDKETCSRYQVALLTEEEGKYLKNSSEEMRSLVYEVCNYLIDCKVQQFRIRLVINDRGLEFHADESDDYYSVDKDNYKDRIDNILNRKELELLLYETSREEIREMKRRG